jgi:hypothetical protein
MRFPLFTITTGLLALMIEMNAESAAEGEWKVETLPPGRVVLRRLIAQRLQSSRRDRAGCRVGGNHSIAVL